MAQEQKMQMPGVFGGLMRYDSEYKSKFMFSPTAIIAFIVAIVLFVLVLKIFFPVNLSPSTGGFGGQGNLILSLLEVK